MGQNHGKDGKKGGGGGEEHVLDDGGNFNARAAARAHVCPVFAIRFAGVGLPYLSWTARMSDKIDARSLYFFFFSSLRLCLSGLRSNDPRC